MNRRSWIEILPCIALVFASGCGNANSRRSFESLGEVVTIIGGKDFFDGDLGPTQEKVVELLGKPDQVYTGPMLKNKMDDETWFYSDTVRHKATGKMQELFIRFKNNRVLMLDVR